MHWKAYGISGVRYGGAKHAILLKQPQTFGKVYARLCDSKEVYLTREIARAR
jgi:hypothetical protein